MATLKEKSQAILDEKIAKILPENIKEGVQVFDITGTLKEGTDTSDATATAKDMVYGKTAYVNGEKITGTVGEDINTDLSYRLNTLEDVPSMKMLSARSVDLPWDRLVRAGCNYSMNIPYETAANTVGLTADKITKGNTILGIEGTGKTSEDLQEQLDNQDRIIEELEQELKNKARVGYNTKAEFGVIEQYWDGQYQRYLTEIDADVAQQIANDSVNHTNTTKQNYMFYNCTSLKSVPLFDTSKMNTFFGMFLWCENLSEIPLFDTSNVTYMPAAFKGCTKLKSIPLLNISKVTNMNETFRLCESLTDIPLLDTSSATIMSSLFYGCTNLVNIPILNTDKVTNMRNIVTDCPSLSDESLNNILAMCKNATNYTYPKTLKDIGLTSEQATKCTTLSNYSAFTSAGWTTGY